MTIEFIEKEHIYLIDGVITPSVSEVVATQYPNSYANVPKHILEEKAEYGTVVHQAIESIIKNTERPEVNFYQSWNIDEYLKLTKKFNIKDCEITVNYHTYYCGRLDILAELDGAKCLIDIKTYAAMDSISKEKTKLQLSLYSLAYDVEHYLERKLFILWLPKGHIGELIEVEPYPLPKLKAIILQAKNEIKKNKGY